MSAKPAPSSPPEPLRPETQEDRLGRALDEAAREVRRLADLTRKAGAGEQSSRKRSERDLLAEVEP